MSWFGPRIGFRYLRAKKTSSFLSVITVISVGGVAVGVMAMFVILSVMGGFESEMKKRLFQAETHVRIESQSGDVPASVEILQKIATASPLIQAVYPVLQTEVIFKSGRKVSGGMLKGVGNAHLDRIKKYVAEWAPSQFLEEGSSRLFIGQELAFEMGVMPGDFVTVVSPLDTEGPFGVVPRVKKFLVEGIYKTGVPEQELHDVYTNMTSVESFLRKEKIYTHIEATVPRLEQSPEAATAVATVLGAGYLVRSWQELNAHLFSSLQLERAVMFCMLTFIVLVASFNIVSMLTMTVIEKKKSLSILRAMGATRTQIGRIFFWEALAIGLLGSFIGGSLGLGICILLKKYPLIELPEFYYDRTLPVLIQPWQLALVVSTTLCIVLVGALLPAKRAAQLTPLAGIRGE